MSPDRPVPKMHQILSGLPSPYDPIMPEYQHIIKGPGAKIDFWEKRGIDGKMTADPNIGWKCHLEVSPEYAKRISLWLKKNSFYHKYLSGGDPVEGKVFTVYFGSRKCCISGVREISDQIGEFLRDNQVALTQNTREPNDEVRFAPKIYGRFVANDTEFAQYGGAHGLPIQKDSQNWSTSFPDTPEKKAVLEMALRKAKKRLIEKYGDYFGGSIPEYKGNGVYAT